MSCTHSHKHMNQSKYEAALGCRATLSTTLLWLSIHMKREKKYWIILQLHGSGLQLITKKPCCINRLPFSVIVRLKETSIISMYVTVRVTAISWKETRGWLVQSRLRDLRLPFRTCLCLFYVWQLHCGLWQNSAEMCHTWWQTSRHLLLALTAILTHH